MEIEKIKQEKSIKELIEFGIINIDKSSGPTSFDTSDFIRKKLGLRKTSHFGTLDPKVTGVLPIALNRACKLTGFFLGEDKEYVGIMRFHEDVSLEQVKKAIEDKFTGKIIQLPPVKSRVKRQEREREIKYFEVIEKKDTDFLFKVECQGGTYIRKLVHDLGDHLKKGAHMLELRRIRAGIFKENDITYPTVNLYDFEKAVEEYENGNEELLRKIIVPGEVVTELFSAVQIKEKGKDKILHGQPIFNENLINKTQTGKFNVNDKITVFCNNKFIGIFKVINQGKIFARSEFVLQPINS